MEPIKGTPIGRSTTHLSAGDTARQRTTTRTHRPDGAPVGTPTPARAPRRHGGGDDDVHGVDSIDSMILPQVHLRKPCYDFSFL